MGCFTKKEKAPKMVDAREVKHSKHKLILGIIWLLIMIVAAVYCALSFTTLRNLQKIYSNKGDAISNHNLWGPLTAASLTPALVVLFFGLGTLLLVRKVWKESGATYSVGILHASVFWLMCILMLSAVTLHAYIDTAQDVWELRMDWKSNYSTVLKATYWFAYILTFCFLFLFVVMFALKDTMHVVDLSGPVQPAVVPQHPVYKNEKPHVEPSKTNVRDQPVAANSDAIDYGSTGPLAQV